MKNIKETRSKILLFITAVIWGVAFVAQKLGADYLGTFSFNALRFALGAVSLLPFLPFLERKGSWIKSLPAGLICGTALFAAASMQQYGIELTGSAGKSAFITGLYIVLVPILGIALRRKTTIFTWIGALVACTGLYFLSIPAGFGPLGVGDLVLLIGAFFWAVHILVIDRYTAEVSPLRFSIVQFLCCSALSFIAALFFDQTTWQAVWDARMPIIYGGALSVGVAYTLQAIGQRHVEPAKAAIIFSFEAMFSAIGAAILLNEILSPRGYMGCAFILAGIITSQLKRKGSC